MLARLENNDLDLEIAKLKAKESQYERPTGQPPRQALTTDRRPPARSRRSKRPWNAVKEQLAQKQEDQRRGCVLTAPARRHRAAAAGHARPHQDETRKANCPPGSGTPLEPREPRRLSEGRRALLPDRRSARSWRPSWSIDQADIDFVHEGQKVDLKLDDLPHDTLHGQIDAISRLEPEDHPAAAVHQGRRRAAQQDRSGHRRGAPAEHVLPGPRPAGRPRRRAAAGPPRPGQDPHRSRCRWAPGSGGFVTHTFNFKL